MGFCLAAGAGSRLAPLTDRIPKPLLAPAGRPLVDLALEALTSAGARRLVVNLHHHAELLGGVLRSRPEVTTLVEAELLGTGGGLGNARREGLLDADVVLVSCADAVVDPADLAALVAALPGSAAGVMGLIPAGGERLRFALGDDGRIRAAADGPLTSAGMYAFRAEALDRIPPGVSSLAGALLEPLWTAGRLAGLPLAGAWTDAGTRERFLAASAGLLELRWPYALPPGELGERTLVADGARVDPTATLTGPVVVDRAARIGAGVVLERAVVGPGAVVMPGATVRDSVLGPGARVGPGATVEGALVAGAG
jgi:mannose-1-phosphate guanylyltransferase